MTENDGYHKHLADAKCRSAGVERHKLSTKHRWHVIHRASRNEQTEWKGNMKAQKDEGDFNA